MSNFFWPSSSSSVTISAIGTNGAAAPTTSIEVGGIDSNGNLQAISVGTTGIQIVSLSGTSPITGHVIVDSGTISLVSSLASGTVTISGTPGVVVSSGTLGLVSVLASGTVTINGAPAISGTVAVSNIASGTVTLNGTPPIAVASGTLGLLQSGTVTLNGSPAISGTVAISAGTISSVASGTVTINGTPGVQAIAKTPAAGTVSQAAITVGTAAVQLTVSGGAPTAGRVALVVIPDASSAAKFYIGASSVTPTGATRGIQIVAGQPAVFNNDASPYYICSDTAAQTVYVMETVP